MKTAISVEGLSKNFKLYNKRVDRLKETFLGSKSKLYHTPFHALKDVTFTIEKGETVGIVGRNGSGKSTLLQVICGILRQNSGTVDVNGRISALLELGAGFNPEFTGRENVYLNASILGMPRDEVDLYFTDILDFADIGSFIDQPVKTYSSGMYVRLAFAVAVNVKPDILIVDEALAVGDTLFQAKCFAKFREFQEKGITILFVTHSMELLARYCTSALLLDMGTLLMQGPAKDVIDEYNRLIVDCSNHSSSDKDSCFAQHVKKGTDGASGNKAIKDSGDSDIKKEGTPLILKVNPKEDRYGNGMAEILDFGVNVLTGTATQTFVHGEEYLFWVKVQFNETLENPIIAYTIKDVKGLVVTGTNTTFKESELGKVSSGDIVVVTFKHVMFLNPGDYLLSFGCAGFQSGEYAVYDRRFDVTPFQVVHDKSTIGVFDMNSSVSVYHT